MANYRYYRYQATKTRSTAFMTRSELGEFALLNGTTRLTGMTVTAPGALTESWAPAEVPTAAADDNLSTKWTNENGTTGFLLYDFGAPVAATGYRVGTGPDSYGVADADPVSWYVDGSNDGTTWTRLDTQTDYPVPVARSTWMPAFTFSEGAPAAPASGLARGGNTVTGMALGATGVTGAALGSRIIFDAQLGGNGTPTPTTLAITASSRAADSTSATITWDTTPGTDGANVTGVRAGRDGTDATGTGPWSTDSTADGSITFNNLRPADTYSFSVQMLRDGVPHGEPVRRILAPAGGTAPTTTTLTATRSGGTGQASITWNVTAGTDGLPVTGVRVGRDGTDATGTGPWTTDVGKSGTQPFLNLNQGTYNLTAQMLVNGAPFGPINTGPVTVTGAPAPTPVGATPSAKWATVQLPARGWFSGGSGAGMEHGSTAFGNWRGETVDFGVTWHDIPDAVSWNQGWGVGDPINNGTFSNFTGLLDISPGGPSRNNYEAAAGGSLDAKWRTFLQTVRANRIVGGVLRPTIFRPCHEYNGTWYAWTVWPGMEDVFKRMMRRWRAIQKEVYPEAFLALCANGDQNSGVDTGALWEDGIWDLYGCDPYNAWPYVGTSATGVVTSWESYYLQDRGGPGKPRGVEAHRRFALSKGVPFYMPEYANTGYTAGNAQSGDDPYYTTQMLNWIKTHRGKGPGQVVADGWFNIAPGEYEDRFWMTNISGGINPKQTQTAAAYKSFFTAL